MSKSKIFLILCASFVTGVFVAPIMNIIVITILAVIFVMCLSIYWSNYYLRLVGFMGLVMVVGILRFAAVMSHNNLAPYYNSSADVTGIVSEEPDVREDKIYLTVADLSVNGQDVDDKILVSVYKSRNFFYGDKVQFSGKILEPTVFPDFNYKNYLSRYGVDAVSYYPTIATLESHQGNRIKADLLLVKEKFVSNLSRVLPSPQDAFLAGLLVGEKRSIPSGIIDSFNSTGTSHIIAISGFNITIIIWAIDWALSRFGRRVSFIVNLCTILAFVVLTGGSASVIRASIMGVLVLFAKHTGRLYSSINALVATAAVMVLINPKLLSFDVGFQLSFLALAGLIILSPILNDYFLWVPKYFREFLVATLAAQIFAIPVLLYNFDQLSLIAPLANILVLPLLTYTMLVGFLTGLVGFVSTILSAIFSWPTYVLLSYIIVIIQICARVPFASLSVHFNLWEMAVYYLILGYILYWYFRKNRNPFIVETSRQIK